MNALDTTRASGIFKFSNNIDPRTLVDFAKKTWSDKPNIGHLEVRGCDGDRKYGIGFVYLHSGDREEFNDFLDLNFGKLRRVFGPDFVGYDVSSASYVIK